MNNPFAVHSREFENFLYVYPVISRRSEGLSIGINLSLRKECNFDCPYCQVDRTHILEKDRSVKFEILEKEIHSIVQAALSGELWKHSRFVNTKAEFRQIKDIAISGDGESTTSKYFLDTAKLVLEIVEQYQKQNLKIAPVVITNATMLHKQEIQEVLLRMITLGGGPWVKLDAGTEEEFKRVAETKISYSKILENILSFSRLTPVILQTIQFYFPNKTLSFTLKPFIQRLNELQSQGAKFNYIQLYTLARDTKIKELNPLTKEELSYSAEAIQKETGILVKVYP
ncbi:MAG: hypothetical protein QXO70_01995 [Candidatus Pacearchaeota archaeon]